MAEYGPNAPTAENREPWYVLFLKQSANPLVYMLIGPALVKAYFKGLVDGAMIGALLRFMASSGSQNDSATMAISNMLYTVKCLD